jgi:predicted solute-binding protein
VVALRLGVVSYLNVEPIIHGIKGDPRFSIIPAVPSRVAQMLHAGEVDLGVIPSVEYASGDYAIVPGIGIASRGAVGSVCLFHAVPVERIRRVALDTSSRTSVALCRVWLRARLGRDPEYVSLHPSLPDMLASADAALLIGDPALFHDGSEPRVDLGAEWTRMTGLPFVYAFWAGRPGAVSPEQLDLLQESLRAGLRSLPSIAAAYNGLGAGRAAESEAYLKERIVYTLGEAEAEGLREFFRRAFALGLVPRVPELRFYGRS